MAIKRWLYIFCNTIFVSGYDDRVSLRSSSHWVKCLDKNSIFCVWFECSQNNYVWLMMLLSLIFGHLYSFWRWIGRWSNSDVDSLSFYRLVKVLIGSPRHFISNIISFEKTIPGTLLRGLNQRESKGKGWEEGSQGSDERRQVLLQVSFQATLDNFSLNAFLLLSILDSLLRKRPLGVKQIKDMGIQRRVKSKQSLLLLQERIAMNDKET